MKLKIFYNKKDDDDAKKYGIGTIILIGLSILWAIISGWEQASNLSRIGGIICELLFLIIFPILIWKSKDGLEKTIECEGYEVVYEKQ